MTIIDDLRALAGRIGDDLERAFRATADRVEREALEHPEPFFAALRELPTVLVVNGIAVVTRYDDVLEVLTHDEAFTVEPYSEKMRRIAGDFVLGTPDGPRHERESSILRLAAPRSDVPAIAAFAAAEAEAEVARGDGRVDVAGLARRVSARVAARWLGVPGPDEETLGLWARAMFEHVFLNVKDAPDVADAAVRASVEAGLYLDGLVAVRRGDGREDVLGRLLAMQAVPATALTDEEVRTNLLGLLIGFLPQILRATTQALDVLLSRPDDLAGAQRAARAGDTARVRAYLWEAMRLAPRGATGLLRRAATDFVIGEGRLHESRIPAGTTVFAATQSAMLDGDVLDDPGAFRVDRPPHHYLHFGAGLHTCLGRHLVGLLVPVLAAAVLRRDGLERAGELATEGPFPASLPLAYSG